MLSRGGTTLQWVRLDFESLSDALTHPQGALLHNAGVDRYEVSATSTAFDVGVSNRFLGLVLGYAIEEAGLVCAPALASPWRDLQFRPFLLDAFFGLPPRPITIPVLTCGVIHRGFPASVFDYDFDYVFGRICMHVHSMCYACAMHAGEFGSFRPNALSEFQHLKVLLAFDLVGCDQACATAFREPG